jgi:hypothetical protein
MSVALGPLVQNALAIARRTGVAGPVRFTRPAAVNGKTGVVSGSATQQDATAVELRPAQLRAFPAESWQRAELGLLVAAADLAWVPQPLTDRAAWGGVDYQVVAVTPTAPTGVAVMYSVGLAR